MVVAQFACLPRLEDLTELKREKKFKSFMKLFSIFALLVSQFHQEQQFCGFA